MNRINDLHSNPHFGEAVFLLGRGLHNLKEYQLEYVDMVIADIELGLKLLKQFDKDQL